MTKDHAREWKRLNCPEEQSSSSSSEEELPSQHRQPTPAYESDYDSEEVSGDYSQNQS
jgi:hypothetical protein